MISSSFKQELYAFLARHNVATLAYSDGQGPGACAVWYAVGEDLALYFLSSPATRHGAALESGGEVAFTVQKDEQDWRAIQGVQGRGWCAPVTEAERRTAWSIYSGRFPFVLRQFPDLQMALTRTTLWMVTPGWLRLIDNTRGFGHKQEIELAVRR